MAKNGFAGLSAALGMNTGKFKAFVVEYMHTIRASIQTTKTQRILEGLFIMIKILFICHGNILKSPGKASKINGFTMKKGTYYTTTTPFTFG